MNIRIRRLWLVVPVLLGGLVALQAQTAKSYFPPPGQWQKKAPAEVGMDAAKLQQAVEFAQSHGSSGLALAGESRADYFSRIA